LGHKGKTQIESQQQHLLEQSLQLLRSKPDWTRALGCQVGHHCRLIASSEDSSKEVPLLQDPGFHCRLIASSEDEAIPLLQDPGFSVLSRLMRLPSQGLAINHYGLPDVMRGIPKTVEKSNHDRLSEVAYSHSLQQPQRAL
jgi:hypothetical protein